MCGFAVVFSYAAEPVDRAELERARDQMVQRGPDGAGLWIGAEGQVGLAHRRLSIIDLSAAGAQPMHSADGRLSVVFNGEIYNYRALRQSLEQSGAVFRTQSDTEVLLHLYAAKGPRMVDDLRGMYAFAIWDARERGVFLARDPLGIKPLYISHGSGVLRAASQVKALLAGGGIDTALSPAGNVGFFVWGHVPEPFTLYRGIRALPAGSWLWQGSDGRTRSETFASVPELFARAEAVRRPLSPDELSERLAAALSDSVEHHLVADVEVGLFLSSGVDSTTLAALAAERGGKPRAVTLTFDEYAGTSNDEVPLARSVAERFGLEHHTARVTQRDFLDERDNLLRAMDQPSIDGVNTYLVSRAAQRLGLKVAWSGTGGDELFAGYPSFRQLPRMVHGLSRVPITPQWGARLRRLAAPVLARSTSPKYAGLLEYGRSYGGAYLLRRGLYMPWELGALFDREFARQGWAELGALAALEQSVAGLDSSRLKVSALELGWYMRNQLLRDADWAGMAHSLEIRLPLVDWSLLQALAPLTVAGAELSKTDMARAPRAPLPQAVLERRKTGFGVPTQRWMEQELPHKARGLRGWAQFVHSAALGRT